MVSVIIPAYSAGKHLKNIINELHQQSYADIEPYIVDDGSLDETPEICDESAQADDRYIVIHKPNAGVSMARNNGMALASGKFITFLDADDSIPTDYIQVLVEKQINTDADVVCCDVALYENGTEISRFHVGEVTLTKIEALNLLLSRRNINSGPYAKLFSRNVIDGCNFPLIKMYEDILFNKDVFERANIISCTSATEYRYIQQSGSAMHMGKHTNDLINATEILADYCYQNNELDPYCYYIVISYFFGCFVAALKAVEQCEESFLENSIRLLRHNGFRIWKNHCFSNKEKILFTGYSVGIWCARALVSK